MARYVEAVPMSTADATQPRALIVTIYGLYARDGTAPDTLAGRTNAAPNSAAADGVGWLPVGLLVRLLAELAGYGLSESGYAVLAEGDARIFAPTEPRLDDGWVLAVFSVPESERAKRHTLRTQLDALGFGACAPGVWIAPADRYELTSASLRRHGLAPYVDLFRGEYLAFGDINAHAREWWDLADVESAYREFIADHRALLPDSAESVDGAHAFALWVRALTAWRRLPYLDPGLPVELLPAEWPAPGARALLAALREALAEPAHSFVMATAGCHRSADRSERGRLD